MNRDWNKGIRFNGGLIYGRIFSKCPYFKHELVGQFYTIC